MLGAAAIMLAMPSALQAEEEPLASKLFSRMLDISNHVYYVIKS